MKVVSFLSVVAGYCVHAFCCVAAENEDRARGLEDDDGNTSSYTELVRAHGFWLLPIIAHTTDLVLHVRGVVVVVRAHVRAPPQI